MKNKFVILFILLIGYTIKSFSQFNKQLCKQNEEIVFAFQLKNQKWVSVCKEKNEQYIVYRFGLPGKIELQYPSLLDSTSWRQFNFKGYTRGGGKQNAAMNYAFLDFINSNIQYEVYETWNSEENKEYCGVSITINKKKVDMRGLLKTRKRALLSLLYGNKIKMEEEE